MHVPSYWSGTQRPRRLGRFAAASLAALAGLVSIVHAAEFDQKLQAPRVVNLADLRQQVQSFAAHFAELQSASPVTLNTDRALSQQRFDLMWQIQQAIDVHKPLGDLSAVGLTAREDGGVNVDLDAFPQWNRLDTFLAGALPQMDLAALGQNLANRGFVEGDMEKLKAYLATHDARAATDAANLPLALSFSKLVKKYDKIKRPVPENVVLSYLYQREKVATETQRAWLNGLLESVDEHSARVLLSFFAESKFSAIWAPSDQAAGIADVLATVRLPDFEQLAVKQAQGEAP